MDAGNALRGWVQNHAARYAARPGPPAILSTAASGGLFVGDDKGRLIGGQIAGDLAGAIVGRRQAVVMLDVRQTTLAKQPLNVEIGVGHGREQ